MNRSLSPTPPKWDLSRLFESFYSESFENELDSCVKAMRKLRVLVDVQSKLLERLLTAPCLEAERVFSRNWSDLLEDLNASLKSERRLSLYASAVIWEDMSNSEARLRHAGIHEQLDELAGVTAAFERLLAALPADMFPPTERAVLAYPLMRIRDRGRRVRNGETDPEFDQLDEPSRRSWIRLYDWARTKSIFEPHGKYHRSDPSAAPLIETVSEISTFCLNALKKTSIVRARRRGFSSVLEESLDSNGVSLDELDCLLEVVKDAFPAIQSFHRAREVTCRRDGRAYDWDVASGVTEGSVLWNWGEAVDILSSKLGKYLPDARSLLKQAVEERWIHADPVPAKRPLGACLPVDDTQSLILVNFRGQARSLIEFAHELGHAYHYHSMAGLPEIAQQTPLVMAEFASTLFEGLLAYGQKDDDDERVYHFLLESFLVSASRILGETYVRFAWEKEVFSIRDARIIGTAELHELFNTMQNSIYGEIAQECAWPSSRWVLNSHFFTAGFSNWQYFYGLVSAMTVLDFMEQSRQSSLRGSLADALRNSSCMTPRGVLKQLGVDTVSRASLERGIRYFTRRVDQFVNEESKPTDQ